MNRPNILLITKVGFGLAGKDMPEIMRFANSGMNRQRFIRKHT